jgi:hypothetical protein
MQRSAEPHTEVHAARHREYAAWRNDPAGLLVQESTMDRHWPIEVENKQVIVYRGKRVLVGSLALNGGIERRPAVAIACRSNLVSGAQQYAVRFLDGELLGSCGQSIPPSLQRRFFRSRGFLH